MNDSTSISDIFTGGLQTALDIEAERARAEIDRMNLAADNKAASKGDSGTLYQKGTVPGVVPSGLSPVLLIGGGLLAVALLVLLLQKG